MKVRIWGLRHLPGPEQQSIKHINYEKSIRDLDDFESSQRVTLHKNLATN